MWQREHYAVEKARRDVDTAKDNKDKADRKLVARLTCLPHVAELAGARDDLRRIVLVAHSIDR